MNVLVPENCRDHCQHLANNPRREGLPKTVTEWRLQREERRRIRREERRRTKDADLKSESESEEISAFDIISSGLQSGNVAPLRRSARIKNTPGRTPTGQASTSRGRKTKVSLAISHNQQEFTDTVSTPTLTLDPSLGSVDNSDQPNNGPGQTAAPENPGRTQAKGKGKTSPPEAFIYALQEPPVAGKRIINIKNVITIMILNV